MLSSVYEKRFCYQGFYDKLILNNHITELLAFLFMCTANSNKSAPQLLKKIEREPT